MIAIVPDGFTEIVEKDLISYWSFDSGKTQGKKVVDGFGKHNGNIQGALKSVKGKIGEALAFDPDKANFVQVDGAKELDFSQDFAWMCWIRTGAKVASVLFAKTGGPGGDDKGPKTWWISDKVLSFDVGRVGNAKDAKAQVTDDKWHHVAVTVEGKAGNIQYYVDGDATGNGQMAVNQFPEDGFKQRVNMGQDGRCDGEFGYYEGLIDEFAVYNRLLTEAEIKQNDNSDRGLSVEPDDKLPLKWSELKVR